jgi:glycosyltransferase involved in cell wall biosynthesis
MATTCWLRRNDYEVAHITVLSGLAFIWAEVTAMILWLCGRPFVLSLHGGNLPSFARRSSTRMRRLLSSAKTVIAPSRYLLEEMKPYRSDILLLPNPLDLKAYPFRLRMNVEPRLIWLRAFHEIYNPSLAARVLALVAQDHPDVQLTMAGPDKGDGSFQRLRDTAGQLKVTQHIHLTGQVPKKAVPDLIARADIFLNTTNVDNTPISVMEAMACGLCIVSTNVGGLPYLLEHENTALLVAPDNPDAMAAAVQRILTEPDLASHLSHNARRIAEQFDWTLVLPKWESLMMTTMSQRVILRSIAQA